MRALLLLGSLPLLAFGLATYLPHHKLFSPFIHTFGGCRESRRVEGESGKTAFGPPTLSVTVFSCDRSVCPEVGSREGERMIPGALDYHPLRQTQGPPETEPDRFISCHKTHFLGGYIPDSPLLRFCSLFPGEDHLRSSPKYCRSGLPPAASGPLPIQASRGNINPGIEV